MYHSDAVRRNMAAPLLSSLGNPHMALILSGIGSSDTLTNGHKWETLARLTRQGAYIVRFEKVSPLYNSPGAVSRICRGVH